MADHQMAGDIASILVELRALRGDVDNLRGEMRAIRADMAVAMSRQNSVILDQKKRPGGLQTTSNHWR